MGFVGFPTNEYDLFAEDVAPGLTGLIVRDTNGLPRGGIFASRPDLVVTSSGWNLQVRPFFACRVRDRTVMLAGSPNTVSVAVSPAPAANARLDVVYTLPPDIPSGDLTTPVLVATGNPGAVPTKPNIPAGAEELATFRVSAGAVSASGGVVTNTFRETVCTGGIIPFRTTVERNAFAAIEGQISRVGSELSQRVGSTWQPLVAKPKAGVLTVTTGTLPEINSTQIYGTTLTINVPAVAGAGEVLEITALSVGSGYGSVSMVASSPGANSTQVTLRFTQVAASASRTLNLLWKIVPIS